MAIDTTPSRVATDALQAIPFSSLIGGPLDACIQAQAQAAQTTWQFIDNVGLTTDPNTGKKEAITVVFQYQKGGEMVNLVVPILTILPIPYIAIETIDINFIANISAASSSVTEQNETTEYGGAVDATLKFGYGPFSVQANFKANYSSKKDSKATQESKYSVEYTMNVAVHAGQSDLPAGLASVLNILQSSITEANPDGNLALSGETFAFTPATTTDTLNIELRAVNSRGQNLAGQEIEITLAAPPTGFTMNNIAVTRGTLDGSPSTTSIKAIADNTGVVVIGISIASVTAGTDLSSNTNMPLTAKTTIVETSGGKERSYDKQADASIIFRAGTYN